MSSEKELPPPKFADIVDPSEVPIVFVDWIVTGGMAEDIVNIALGTLDHSMRILPEDLPRVIVAARLRLSKSFAYRLHHALGNVLGIPAQEGEGFQNSPPPPKNTIN